nr:MAG: nitrogen fixation protein FixH [Pseudomonadota bacterium]
MRCGGAMMSAKRSEGLTGRHVLIGVLAFFGTVFLANGIFLYSALSTYTGVVADEPYRKGLHYNKRIAAAERQESLGWSAETKLVPEEGLSLVLRDRNGRPVSGLFVSGVVGRPSTNRHDRKVTLIEVEPGRYAAPIEELSPGAWLVDLQAVWIGTGDKEPVYRLRKREWVKS